MSSLRTPVADLHAHTIASGHAFNTLDELAQSARDAGLILLGVTDHGPTMAGAPTHGYFEMVRRIPPILHGVRILFGCEANIVDTGGRIDLNDEWADQQHLLLAGLHARTPYPPDTTNAQNTAALVQAAQNSAVHIISHPYREGFPVDAVEVADAASATGTLLEINLSLFRGILAANPDLDTISDNPTVQATRAMLDRLRENRGGFVLSSDSHHSSELSLNHAMGSQVCDLLGVRPHEAANSSLELLARYLPELGRRTRAHESSYPVDVHAG